MAEVADWTSLEQNVYSSIAVDERSSRRQREASLLLSLAETHLAEEAPEEALTAANDAIQVFEEINDKASAADCARVLAAAHCALGSHELGEALLLPLLETARQAKDRRNQACLLLAMAETAMSEGSADAYSVATDCFKEARELSVVAGESHMEVLVLLEQAKMQLQFRTSWGATEQLRLDASESLCEEALRLSEELGDKLLGAKCWQTLARARIAAGSTAEALAAASTARSHFKALGLRKEEAKELQFMAAQQLKAGQAKEAVARAKETLQLVAALGGPARLEREATDVCVLGQLQLGQADAALALLTPFLEASEKGLKQRSEGHALHWLAQCHLAKDETEDAIIVMERAIVAFRHEKDAKHEAKAFGTLARIHVKLKQWDAACQVNDAAVSRLVALHDLEGAAQARHWIVEQLLGASEGEKAVKQVDAALLLFRGTGDIVNEAIALLSASTAYRIQGNLDKVVAKAELAQALFDEQGKPAWSGRARHVVAEAYQCAGKLDDAIEAWSSGRALMQEADDKKGEAASIFGLHSCYVEAQHFKAAASLAQESRVVFSAPSCGKQGKVLEARMLTSSAQVTLKIAVEDANARAVDHKDLKFREVAMLALEDARLAVAAAKKAGDASILCYARITLAQVYVAMRKPHDALRVLHEASLPLQQLAVPQEALEAQYELVKSEACSLLGQEAVS